MKSKRDLLIEYKKLLTLLGMITTTTIVSGCSKEVDCPIEDQHAHVYVVDYYGLKRYVISEKEKIDNLTRTDDYILVSDEKAKEINETNSDSIMYDIDLNWDYFSNFFEDDSHLEYEYQDVVNINASPIRVEHRWTDNPNLNEDYTGEERIVKSNVAFTIYKPIITENGKVDFDSEVIYDLNEIPDGYTYFYMFPRFSEDEIYDEEEISKYKEEYNIKTR